MTEGPSRAGSSHPNGSPVRNANPIPSLPNLLSQQAQSGAGTATTNVTELVTGSARNDHQPVKHQSMELSLPVTSLPPAGPPPGFPVVGHPAASEQYAVEGHTRSYDPNRSIDPHRRTPSMPPSTNVPMAIDNIHPSQSAVRPINEAFAVIAPRKPGATHAAPRNVPKPQRAKRRRLIGAGRHWAPAVDKFVQDIPPVPYFSDPRRNAPQRDMRGWITTISKPAQKLVWDRLMGALTQDDLNDNGDEDICRHILGSVVHEAQDPTSEKRQTRQAVNNAIKRELSLPKASGQTGRGETFRELFREKAVGAGFRLTPVEKGEKDHSVMDEDMGISSVAGGGLPSHDVSGNSMFHNGDPRMTSVRRPHSQNSGSGVQGSSLGMDGFGFNAILDAAEASRWNAIIRGCEKTAAGETAWWTSNDMKVADMNHLAQYLVRMGKVSELKRLLIDFRWLRKLASSSNHGIMQLVKKGFDILLSVKTAALSSFEREGYRLIRNALMLVTPILRPKLIFGTIVGNDIEFCAHLGTQLFGRLLNASRKFAVVATLLESIRTHVQPPWLRPLNPSFDAPKTDIALAVKSGPGALASALAISSDGELLVTTGTEMRGVKQNVRVWEVATGSCLSTIPVESVHMLAISPNKKHVVSVSMGNDGPLMFWNIVDDKRRFIEHVKEETVVRAVFKRSTIFSVVITPDSKYVISASENKIIKWNILTGLLEIEFTGVSGTIYSMDLSPDGKLLLAGTAQGVIGLWTVENGSRVLLIKNEGETASPNVPKQIACGTDVKGAKLEDNMKEVKSNDRVFSVSFMMKRTPPQDTDGAFRIVSGGLGKFRIWTIPKLEKLLNGDSVSFELTQAIQCEGLGIINNMRCTDEKSVFFASGDGLVRLWKMNEGKIVNSIELGTEPPMRFTMEDLQGKNTTAIFLAVSDDGMKVAASTDRPFVLVWDVGQYEETLKEQRELRDQSYFPCNPGSVSFTDIVQPGRAHLHPEFNKYLSNAIDSKTELRILRKKENENDLKLVFHPNMEERSIVFDQNIDLDHCRVGVFIKPEKPCVGPVEMEMPMTAEEIAMDRREGVGVRFKDKNIAFFEAERGIGKLRLSAN